jgi:TP901 family phage tail tape measure protein
MAEHKYSIRVEAKDNASSELKKLRDELGRLRDIDAFASMKKQAEASRQAFEEATQRVSALAREMKSGAGDTKALAKQFEAAKGQAQKMKAAMLADRDAVHNLRKSLQESGVATRNFAAEQRRLKDAAEQTRKVVAAQALLGVRPYADIQADIKRTRQAYDTLKNSGRLSQAELARAHQQMRTKVAELRKETTGWSDALNQAHGGLIAMAAAGYAVVKAFGEYSRFTQRMAEVSTLIDVNRERLAALGSEIQRLDIPQTADELAAAEYDILSAGVALEKSVGVLELAGKAAVGGVTDTKTAAGVGLAVINAYGKEIDALGSVYDVLFTTVKKGVTTFPALAQSIGEVLPTARAAGTDLQSVGAAIAAMTKAGIQTPKAATALKGALNALSAPAPEAKKQFEALGITWQGLIPTLEALRAKSLDVEQMRMLIPDVEARTGVLALVQNFETLLEILGEMDAAGGATEAAYRKMKDTPENQLKMFRKEIGLVAHAAGELAAAGLLPAARAVRWLMQGMREADGVTKVFVGGLATAAAGMAAWKLGLGAVVLGLKSLVAQAHLLAAGMTGAGAAATAAGLAIKGGLALGAAYGVVQIGRAVAALYQWRQAAKEASDAQQRLMETTGKSIARFQEFADVRLPEDFAALPTDQVERFRAKLIRARAYWVALKTQLETKADETTWLGQSTDEARAAQAELGQVNARLAQVNRDLKAVSAASAETGEDLAAAAVAGKEAVEEYEAAAKKAYEEAAAEANKYADRVIALEEKIRQSRLSTEDKIRALRQRGMTDEEAYYDRQRQIQEKLSAARAAAAAKDYDAAEDYYQDVVRLAERSVGEIKSEGENQDVVVPLDVTLDAAIATIETAGKEMERLVLEPQRNAAEQSYQSWREAAEKIKADLDAVVQARQADIRIELQRLNEARSALADLTRTETKTIIIRTVRQEAKAAGGMVGLATGGRLPGYGGGDRVRALLEAGEYVVRKEAVRKYGAGLLEAINNMRLQLPGIVQARLGGLVPEIRVPVPRFAAGGPVSASAEEAIVLELRAGNSALTTRAAGGRAAVKALEKELVRMGLAYAG